MQKMRTVVVKRNYSTLNAAFVPKSAPKDLFESCGILP
jgi:hypothetical protein